VRGGLVAHRYTRAFFAVGAKRGLGELEKLARELSLLKEALAEAPRALGFFRSPVFSAADKAGVLDEILARLQVGKSLCNFCRLLAENGRLPLLPAIADYFSELLDAEKGIIRGELVTAVELDEHKRGSVLRRLSERAGRDLALVYSVDPGLLGGVMLKVGDRVMDASLRAQLSILKEQIKRGV
jgi:F-type H+-transporting ATPase subunit delta